MMKRQVGEIPQKQECECGGSYTISLSLPFSMIQINFDRIGKKNSKWIGFYNDFKN